MGFGNDGLTVASHSVMVVILVTLLVRSMLMYGRGLGEVAIKYGLFAVLSICAFALIIERLYYITARLVRSSGINLWALHPAPEALSLVVGTGFYAIMIPMVRAKSSSKSAATRQVTLEISGLIAVWFFVVWMLY